MNFMQWWNKYGPAIASISIIIFVTFGWYMVYKDHQLKLEINENCGWGEDDYRCYCEKSEAMEIKNKLDGLNNQFDLEMEGIRNVTIDG